METNNEKLSICIISQEYPPYTNWGGIATYNYEFANTYSRLGHHVTIISRMSKGAPEFQETDNGIKIWRIGKTVFRKFFVGRTIDKIIHSKTVYHKIKELERISKFDVIETTEAGLEGEMLLNDPIFSNRIVIQCNGSNAQTVIPNGLFSFIHKIDTSWSLKREIASMKLARNVLVTSEATRQILLNCGLNNSNIKLIYQGIDIDRFKPAQENKIPNSPLNVGFVGRLEEIKGIDFIWRILEKIEPEDGIVFHFKGAVHWTSKKDTERRFKQFSKMVVYHQPGLQSEMPSFYQSLHVLLQPSRFENFGLAYVEAMASELIVIAGKNGGGSEIISDNETGFIVNPDSESDVGFVVEKLKAIASDYKSMKNMGIKARKKVVENFSLKACAREKISYYKNSIESKS